MHESKFFEIQGECPAGKVVLFRFRDGRIGHVSNLSRVGGTPYVYRIR